MMETEQLTSIPAVVRELLRLIGEDPSRKELKKTPERFSKAIMELTAGYSMDIESIVNDAIYPSKEATGLVLIRDIEFHSLCEHHLLPFHGKIHVGYIPNQKIIGLSKIPRIVQMYSRRLQLQEQLTHQIANALDGLLAPEGIGVLAEARHMCLEMRGAKAKNSNMLTTCYLGKFRDCPTTRAEFLSLIKR